MHDIAVDIGQAEVAAIVAEGELLVIQAQKVEYGGVEIVMRDGILDSVHPELVGRAVRDPRLDTAARHPHGEAVVVMAAPDGFFRKRLISLLKRRATELSGPNDERVVEQTA